MLSTHSSPTGEPPPAAWLRRLELGSPLPMSGLELTPLLAPEDGARDYLLLHEALSDLTIEEVATGQVSRITAFNRGQKPVLILEGQTVTGAKQNRVVATTVLVAVRSMVELDVGCVEQGRWSSRYGAFTPGKSSVAPMMRAATVKEAKLAGKLNQARLWKDVAHLMGIHGETSPTSDYLSLLEKQKAKVEERSRLLEPQPRQLGTLVLEGGRLVALELLGHADAWRAMAPQLLGSYLLEAEMLERMRGERPDRSATHDTAADWLDALTRAGTTLRPAAGLGLRLALDGRGPRGVTIHGSGLWFGDRPVHLAVFAEAK